jgi:hypothetical protein
VGHCAQRQDQLKMEKGVFGGGGTTVGAVKCVEGQRKDSKLPLSTIGHIIFFLYYVIRSQYEKKSPDQKEEGGTAPNERGSSPSQAVLFHQFKPICTTDSVGARVPGAAVRIATVDDDAVQHARNPRTLVGALKFLANTVICPPIEGTRSETDSEQNTELHFQGRQIFGVVETKIRMPLSWAGLVTGAGGPPVRLSRSFQPSNCVAGGSGRFWRNTWF